MMTLDVACLARLFTVPLGLIVLLAILEQPILAGVVVLPDLLWIVAGTRPLHPRLTLGCGRLVKLSVARIVAAAASLARHDRLRWLCSPTRATGMPTSGASVYAKLTKWGG